MLDVFLFCFSRANVSGTNAVNLCGFFMITPYFEVSRTLLKLNASFKIGPGEVPMSILIHFKLSTHLSASLDWSQSL